MDETGTDLVELGINMIIISVFAFVLFQQWRNGKNDVIVAFAVFVTCFNLYTINLVAKDLSDSIEQFCWFIFVVNECSNNKGYHYFLLGVSASFNPSNVLFALINIKATSKLGIKVILFVAGALLGVTYLFTIQGISIVHYYDLYFPDFFEPQFNLLWILYAHVKVSLFRCSTDF